MNPSDTSPGDWKLNLRYGKLTTPYSHYTALAEGRMERANNDFGAPLGPAWMGMKMWASSADESADMIESIGRHIGFSVTGKIQVYATEAVQPPRENPFGYDIKFTPFKDDKPA